MSALTGLTGTSSFGGTPFWIQQSGERATPRRGSQAVYDKKHIPYGNSSIIQLGGNDVPALQINILIKTTDYAALVAKVGTANTLALLNDGSTTAVLVAVTGARVWSEGFMLASANFEY